MFLCLKSAGVAITPEFTAIYDKEVDDELINSPELVTYDAQTQSVDLSGGSSQPQSQLNPDRGRDNLVAFQESVKKVYVSLKQKYN